MFVLNSGTYFVTSWMNSKLKTTVNPNTSSRCPVNQFTTAPCTIIILYITEKERKRRQPFLKHRFIDVVIHTIYCIYTCAKGGCAKSDKSTYTQSFLGHCKSVCGSLLFCLIYFQTQYFQKHSEFPPRFRYCFLPPRKRLSGSNQGFSVSAYTTRWDQTSVRSGFAPFCFNENFSLLKMTFKKSDVPLWPLVWERIRLFWELWEKEQRRYITAIRRKWQIG